MNNVHAETTCPLCASDAVRDLPFGYRFESMWLGALECDVCGIIFIHPQPSAKQLEMLYSKEYFEGDFRCGHEGSYFDTGTLDRLVDETLLEKIARFKTDGTFLEIGCAGGALLDAARRRGYTVNGVEFADAAAEFARSHFGLDVRTGQLKEMRFPSSHFDVVFMGDVIEHLPTPLEELAEVFRIMRQDGILVIACPTQTNTMFSRAGFWVYRLLGKKVTVQLPPYHLFEYRPSSLRRILQSVGFEVLDISATAISPGRIALRGSSIQRCAKLMLQYPNVVITKASGFFGDRIRVIVRKP